MIRMTFKVNTYNNKKPVANKRRKKRKNRVRKTEFRETKANNEASVRTNSRIFNIKTWIHVIEDELREMNSKKRGRPYAYCMSMMLWLVYVVGYNRDTTFRKAAGIAEGILGSHGIEAPHYSTVFRRLRSLWTAVSDSKDGKILSSYVRPKTGSRKHRIAVDSTGLNLSKTTLWRENKWGTGPKRRGWLKLHAAIDIDSGEILAYVLTDDRTGDNTVFISLIKMILSEGYDVNIVFADNAYEAIDNWKFLHERKIKFVVKFRSNTIGVSRGCMARGESAQLWIREGEDKWKELTGYGMRWKAECAFSDFKRLAAETISATGALGMAVEVLIKIHAYNLHKRIRADIIGITGNNIYVAED
ncbi:MAG: IS5 family transposase [Trichococcus flocculiformis]|uniref:IS5 family transposase n=1 Tax=Trichococcus flocculiformis TaxID=82803 RepID=A0A847D534_9LACT|nr:IS5 family transposase [Trichococcus flocculiformis]NLD31494.1 IS5 family transposase [Trichococcus flocculiformis]